MDSKLTDPPEPSQPVRLLRTKLFIPRVHADLVMRTGLINRLNESLDSRLTLIIAPAGFGKSTLVSSWAASLDELVAWVSLDERDNDPVRFWTYLIAALQNLQPSIGETALAMLKVSKQPSMEPILTELLNDAAALSKNLILILDDYHVITTEAIHRGLIFLIDNLPPQLHLVIASRAVPPFPLPRLRGRRNLVEINLASMRFTADEAAAFFTQSMRLTLEKDDIARLVSLTEGWIAGLQLAALSIQDTGDTKSILKSFSGSHKFVFDYLAQEVLDRQPAIIQQFLLRAAILDRFSSSLIDAVLENDFFQENRDGLFPDSQSVMAYLERTNLFIVPLDQQRQWFRFHHLFIDFLRVRLSQAMNSEQIAILNIRASDWYERNGFYQDSINHALSAKNYKRMAFLIMMAMPEIYSRNELYTFLGWIDALPVGYGVSFPEFSMVCVWMFLATSQVDKVERYIGFVETAFGFKADESANVSQLSPKALNAFVEVLCVRGNLAFHAMELDRAYSLSSRALEIINQSNLDGFINSKKDLLAVAQFNQAMTAEFRGNLGEASILFSNSLSLSRAAGNNSLITFSYSHLGGINLIQGRLREAAAIYQEAWQLAEGFDGLISPMAGIAKTGSGVILYEQNALDEAENSLLQGIELGKLWANWEIIFQARLALAKVKIARHLFDEVGEVYTELEEFAAHSQVSWGIELVAASRALLAACQGDLVSAQTWLDRNTKKIPAPLLAASQALLRLHILAACGADPGVISLAKELLPSVELNGETGRLIEILAAQSAAFFRLGDRSAAVGVLDRALGLAQPQGYMRVFLDEGPAMRDLLAEYRNVVPMDLEMIEYVTRLQSGFDPISTLVTHSTNQPRGLLSERELDVLRLMAEGCSNQAIADRLVVSLNTIKTHIKAIFDQLEVNNRTQATARARKLGLL